MIDVKVPAVGESITEGILAEWLKAEGDAVGRDEPLFVLETDKVTLTVNAESSGRLSILVPAGEAVKVGQVVGRLDPAGAPAAKAAPPLETSAGLPQAAAKVTSMAAEGDLSPAVRRMVQEFGLDPASIPATGRDGRLTKEDIVKHLESEKAGSGKREAGHAEEPAPRPAGPSTPAPVAPPPAPGTRQTRTPMSSLRQRIAERLVLAQREAAILTTFNEADLTEVLALRERFGEAFKARHGVSLGFMSFFVKAAVEALRAVPALNAQIQGNEIVQNHYYDIGVAVSSDRGLSVPVIRDCDRLSLAEIERAVAEKARRVRERTITLEELTGGVFSISNAGVFGGLMGTPILNPPQSGILGVYSLKRRPVAVGDRVEIRPMVYLALSYDHRLVDGKEASQFLVRTADALEHPGSLLLDL